MSSLIFHTEASQVFVATDTLATSAEGKPFLFTSKAFVVPHLRMIVAGTGVGGFLGKWFIQVNDRMVVKGIDHLDYHTPESLAGIWRTHKEECSVPDHLTTSVYHFGFSEEEEVIHTYVYRSYNDFRSESLPYGMAVKPQCEVPKPYEFPADVKTMMDSQRAIQADRPKNERIYIGGEIMIHHLTAQGYSIYPLAEFADYELSEQAIYENFEQRKND